MSEAAETTRGALDLIIAAAKFFGRAIKQFVVGFIVTLLRTIPVLIWIAAVGFWGWSLYRLLVGAISIYAPDHGLVPMIGWIAIISLTNAPVVFGMLWQAGRSNKRKEALMKYPGALAAIGFLDFTAARWLLALWQTAPLFALALPHLFLGAGLVLSGRLFPNPTKEVAHG